MVEKIFYGWLFAISAIYTTISIRHLPIRSVDSTSLLNFRSSHPEVFSTKGVLKIYSKFTGEHPYRSVISIKLLCNFVEIALPYECSLVNLLHILRTPFPKKLLDDCFLNFLNIFHHMSTNIVHGQIDVTLCSIYFLVNENYDTCFLTIVSIDYELLMTFMTSEAATQSCSIKKMFSEISQNSQENVCAKPWHRCFPWILWNF